MEFVDFMQAMEIETYAEAAKLLGVSLDTIRSWASGRRFPKRTNLAKMREIYEQKAAATKKHPRPGAGGITGCLPRDIKGDGAIP